MMRASPRNGERVECHVLRVAAGRCEKERTASDGGGSLPALVVSEMVGEMAAELRAGGCRARLHVSCLRDGQRERYWRLAKWNITAHIDGEGRSFTREPARDYRMNEDGR